MSQNAVRLRESARLDGDLRDDEGGGVNCGISMLECTDEEERQLGRFKDLKRRCIASPFLGRDDARINLTAPLSTRHCGKCRETLIKVKIEQPRCQRKTLNQKATPIITPC